MIIIWKGIRRSNLGSLLASRQEQIFRNLSFYSKVGLEIPLKHRTGPSSSGPFGSFIDYSATRAGSLMFRNRVRTLFLHSSSTTQERAWRNLPVCPDTGCKTILLK